MEVEREDWLYLQIHLTAFVKGKKRMGSIFGVGGMKEGRNAALKERGET